jgi:hypothetical protein
VEEAFEEFQGSCRAVEPMMMMMMTTTTMMMMTIGLYLNTIRSQFVLQKFCE